MKESCLQVRGALCTSRCGPSANRTTYRTLALRVGNYRLVCRIEDQKIIVLIVAIAHRKDTYR
ncbi:MAG: type II toxin-antitoxin system RelE/ParE family toxin [Acidobacteria bacterium]|nr:type II toxin-antitoxin system RelE/ParE family toxin [Acidobacteriota bacterium]